MEKGSGKMAKSIRKNDKPRRKNDRTHRKEGGDAFTPTKATDPSDPIAHRTDPKRPGKRREFEFF